MASAFGWYGPLIDLSRASFHVGDFVQLLLFVHRSTPFQYKSSKGRNLTRTDIQVGDDTCPYFGVSIWQKNMGSMISPGDVILLQNVKVVKFGDLVEARTVQWSSLLCLIHHYESLISKGIEELVADCRVGMITKDKLRKVITWVQQSRSSICNISSYQSYQAQQTKLLPRNWKVVEERMPRDCFSLSEVSQLASSCKATVCAFIGEIFLQMNTMVLGDTDKEKIFLSRRVYKSGDNNLVKDLICTGCQLCGSPMDSGLGQNAIPFSCLKSSSRLHAVCSIYRPFMLYVWDESDYMPILVKNRAAEILFGNIKAEKVYSSYRQQMPNLNHDGWIEGKDKVSSVIFDSNPNDSGDGLLSSCSLNVDKRKLVENQRQVVNFNFYQVWLIFLKMLLQQGKNSPLKFEITVDPSLDIENGKFEMVDTSMPCCGTE
ncbi:Nucleic acid-binding [Senna tora]|uniref:Nucleic acid-binding n=1 Tax=Senna tora TaxID=362788 RepID=A0A834TG81_9FABA|nr:Nucleic acid-binding [Senna tora]